MEEKKMKKIEKLMEKNGGIGVFLNDFMDLFSKSIGANMATESFMSFVKTRDPILYMSGSGLVMGLAMVHVSYDKFAEKWELPSLKDIGESVEASKDQ